MIELLERLEAVYQPERDAYRIKFRVDRHLSHAAFATNFDGHCYLITVRGTLRTDLALEAAGMCVARIVLGHDFKRMGYREEYQRRDLWLKAFVWLGRRLIPDALISRMQRKGWDRCDLAEQAGATDHLTMHRLVDWKNQRGELVTFPLSNPDVLARAIATQEAQWCDVCEAPFFCSTI